MATETQETTANQNVDQPSSGGDVSADNTKKPPKVVTNNFQSDQKPRKKIILAILAVVILSGVLGGIYIYKFKPFEKDKEVPVDLTQTLEPPDKTVQVQLGGDGKRNILFDRYVKESGSIDLTPIKLRMKLPDGWDAENLHKSEECTDYLITNNGPSVQLLVKDSCGKKLEETAVNIPATQAKVFEKTVETREAIVRYYNTETDSYNYGTFVSADADSQTVDVYPFVILKVSPEDESTWVWLTYKLNFIDEVEDTQEMLTKADEVVNSIYLID